MTQEHAENKTSGIKFYPPGSPAWDHLDRTRTHTKGVLFSGRGLVVESPPTPSSLNRYCTPTLPLTVSVVPETVSSIKSRLHKHLLTRCPPKSHFPSPVPHNNCCFSLLRATNHHHYHPIDIAGLAPVFLCYCIYPPPSREAVLSPACRERKAKVPGPA